MNKEPLKVYADEGGRLEVDVDHYYNPRCQCEACTSMWLGIECGAIEVFTHDGEPAEGRFVKIKEK